MFLNNVKNYDNYRKLTQVNVSYLCKKYSFIKQIVKKENIKKLEILYFVCRAFYSCIILLLIIVFDI